MSWDGFQDLYAGSAFLGTHKRGRPADDLALGVVLRPVARAHELVLRLVPRHDATQVSAHGVDPECRDGEVLLDGQVRGVTLRHSMLLLVLCSFENLEKLAAPTCTTDILEEDELPRRSLILDLTPTSAGVGDMALPLAFQQQSLIQSASIT